MEKFSKLIDTAAGNLIFYFYEFQNLRRIRWQISLVDNDANVRSLEMSYDKGLNKWVVSKPDDAPDWFLEKEEEMARLIQDYYFKS